LRSAHPLSDGTLALLGRARAELPTPVLLLDAGAATANIALLAARFAGGPRLRPHGKSHKCAELAHLQVRAGAIGLTVATAWEAIAFAQHGIDDLLVANEVTEPTKLAHLAAAARENRITVAVDDAGNARALAAAARAAGSTLGVLIDVDVGLGRCGLRDPAAALPLAEIIASLPGLELRGVMGYEGHFPAELDASAKEARAADAMRRLFAVVDLLRSAGHATGIVSAGGTSTTAFTGKHPGVTELQAGSYVLMDNGRRPVAPEFQPALTVLASVVSRQGSTLVLDAGRRTIGLELAAPSLVGVPATFRRGGDEHLIFDLADESPLRAGDRVEIIPGYAPTTINLHEAYLVLRDDAVAEVWPILARGAGQPWVP
jgi:D-serine deaminase-like pyridoxal phosphate-dependent protein